MFTVTYNFQQRLENEFKMKVNLTAPSPNNAENRSASTDVNASTIITPNQRKLSWANEASCVNGFSWHSSMYVEYFVCFFLYNHHFYGLVAHLPE